MCLFLCLHCLIHTFICFKSCCSDFAVPEDEVTNYILQKDLKKVCHALRHSPTQRKARRRWGLLAAEVHQKKPCTVLEEERMVALGPNSNHGNLWVGGGVLGPSPPPLFIFPGVPSFPPGSQCTHGRAELVHRSCASSPCASWLPDAQTLREAFTALSVQLKALFLAKVGVPLSV